MTLFSVSITEALDKKANTLAAMQMTVCSPKLKSLFRVDPNVQLVDVVTEEAIEFDAYAVYIRKYATRFLFLIRTDEPISNKIMVMQFVTKIVPTNPDDDEIFIYTHEFTVRADSGTTVGLMEAIDAILKDKFKI